MAKLRPNEKVVDKNQPGPIRCLYGPRPTTKPFLFSRLWPFWLHGSSTSFFKDGSQLSGSFGKWVPVVKVIFFKFQFASK